jgi:hypothetical protein
LTLLVPLSRSVMRLTEAEACSICKCPENAHKKRQCESPHTAFFDWVA